MDLELFSQDGGLRKHLDKVEPAMAAKSEEFSKLESAWARYEFLRQDFVRQDLSEMCALLRCAYKIITKTLLQVKLVVLRMFG